MEEIRSGRNGMGLRYALEGVYRVTLGADDLAFQAVKRGGHWDIAQDGEIPPEVVARLIKVAKAVL